MVETVLQEGFFSREVLDRARERLTVLERRLEVPGARRAAVLIPLCHEAGAPAVLFTRRSETVGTHKGQVSFPGGMVDPEDEGAAATALRELHEELGVAPHRVEVLGLFHDVMSITGVAVTPVVGFLGDLEALPPLEPNPDEIDGVFCIRLADLLDPGKRYMQVLGASGELPVFEAGPWPVWGLTAFILDRFLQEVMGAVPPATVTLP